MNTIQFTVPACLCELLSVMYILQSVLDVSLTQNMQIDGGRDKTPIMHSLKKIDQIINITCLSMSPGFVTVVL